MHYTEYVLLLRNAYEWVCVCVRVEFVVEWTLSSSESAAKALAGMSVWLAIRKPVLIGRRNDRFLVAVSTELNERLLPTLLSVSQVSILFVIGL